MFPKVSIALEGENKGRVGPKKFMVTSFSIRKSKTEHYAAKSLFPKIAFYKGSVKQKVDMPKLCPKMKNTTRFENAVF